MGKSTKLVSAIDVGSNTIRMIIAEIGENTGINIIDEVKKPIDIGKDTYNYGKISIETIKEACKILKNFKKLMLDYRVTEYRAVSTSGIRESANWEVLLTLLMLLITVNAVCTLPISALCITDFLLKRLIPRLLRRQAHHF